MNIRGCTDAIMKCVSYQVLALVVRAAMLSALQDRVIYDDIRHSGRLILEELDKVFEPLGETARIRMMAQLYACKLEQGESIIDFLCRIRKLVDLLAAAGAPVSNQVLHEIIPKCIRDQPRMHRLVANKHATPHKMQGSKLKKSFSNSYT